MRSRSLSLVSIGALFLAFTAILSSSLKAQALTCYDNSQKPPVPIPCPKSNYKNPTQPVYPTKPPTPTATAVSAVPPAPLSVVNANPNLYPVNPTPVACVNSSNTGSGNGQFTGGTGGSPFFPYMLGGGGLFLGILIGLLLPAVRNAFGGGGGIGKWPGPVTQGSDPSKKHDEAGVVIAIQPGEAGSDFYKPHTAFGDGSVQKLDVGPGGGPHTTQDEAGAAVDMFHKDENAGFGDGSVHPSNDDAAALFIKRGGAGITDGASLSGNNTFENAADEGRGGPPKIDDWAIKKNDAGFSGSNELNGDG